jgi:hypothetical protein
MVSVSLASAATTTWSMPGWVAATAGAARLSAETDTPVSSARRWFVIFIGEHLSPRTQHENLSKSFQIGNGAPITEVASIIVRKHAPFLTNIWRDSRLAVRDIGRSIDKARKLLRNLVEVLVRRPTKSQVRDLPMSALRRSPARWRIFFRSIT